MKQMKDLMQIVLTCLPPVQNKTHKVDIKSIVLNNIRIFKETYGTSSIQKFLISKILNPNESSTANSFIVIWKDNDKFPPEYKTHITQITQIKKIKYEIETLYKIKSVDIQHIYPFAHILMYNMFIAGQNRIAIFIRPFEKQLAYKLGAFLINTLRSNFKELDFKLKINQYKEQAE